MLPKESLLQVLYFADYKTLVLAKRAARRFLLIGIKFAEELALRRFFRIKISTTYISCNDVKYVEYAPGNQASFAATCRELDEVIGPHAVSDLTFCSDTWNIPGIGAVFEAAAPLRYAEDLILYSFKSDVSANSEAFMSNFDGLKSLRLWLDYDTFRQFSWTFLRHESARSLRLIKIYNISLASTKTIEELVRTCATLPPRLGGEAMEVDLSESCFFGAFGLRTFEMLGNSTSKVIFRMRTFQSGGELVLDESEYVVDVDDATTRYTSKNSGIVVEVTGRSITI